MPLSPSDLALGTLLVGRRVITLAQLDEAVALAEIWEVRLGDALLSRNWIDPGLYSRTYAQHFDLPFVDLIREPPDPTLLRVSETDIYVARLTMPWRHGDDRLLIATAEPGSETLLFARGRWGAAIEFVVVSKFDIVAAVQQAFADALSHRAVFELSELDPHMSARLVFSRGQLIICYLLLTALLAGFAFAPLATLIALNVAVSLIYLANFCLKGILVSVGGGRAVDADQTIAVEARALRDEELPVFTVLVPMFGEAAMLPRLAQALRDLDYPLGKLDIKIVLEAGDRETIAAARNLGLEGVRDHHRAVVQSANQAQSLQFRATLRARRISGDLRRRGPARARSAAQGGRHLPPLAAQYGVPPVPAELLQRQRKLAHPDVHARLRALVRPGAAGPGPTIGIIAASYRNGMIILVAPEFGANSARELGEALHGTVSKLRLPNPESVASDHVTASVATVTGLVKGSIERLHLLTKAIAKVQDAASAGGNRVLALTV